jgi:hypothetical protein
MKKHYMRKKGEPSPLPKRDLMIGKRASLLFLLLSFILQTGQKKLPFQLSLMLDIYKLF